MADAVAKKVADSQSLNSSECGAVPQRPTPKAIPVYQGRCIGGGILGTDFGWDGTNLPRVPVPLERGVVLELSFVAPANNLSEVLLLCATYNRQNSCSVTFHLFDDLDPVTPLREVKIGGQNFKDNSFQSFGFAPVEFSKGRCFLVRIFSSDAGSRNVIAVWTTVIPEIASREESSCTGILGLADRAIEYIRDEVRVAGLLENNDGSQSVSEVFVPRYVARCYSDALRDLEFGWSSRSFRTVVAPVIAGAPLSLTFCCPNNGLNQLTVYTATYLRKNTCDVHFQLLEHTAHGVLLLREFGYNGTAIQDNAPLILSIPPIQSSADRWFELRVTSADGDLNNCIGIYGDVLPKTASFLVEKPKLVETGIYSQVDFQKEIANLERFLATPRRVDASRFKELSRSVAKVALIAPELTFIEAQRLLADITRDLEHFGACVELLPIGLATANLNELDQRFHFFIVTGLSNSDEVRNILKFAKHSAIPVLGWVCEPLDSQRTELSADVRREISKFTDGQLSVLAQCNGWIVNGTAEIAPKLAGVNSRPPEVFWCCGDADALWDGIDRLARLSRERYLPKFSVISVLYNKAREIEYFLTALLRADYQGEIEIVLVDDRSPDDSVELVNRYLKRNKIPENRTIKVVSNPANLGNCGSRNQGIESASGDVYVIIDADVVVNRDFFEAHANAYAAGDCDAVVGYFNLETYDRPPLAVLEEFESDPERVVREAELQDRTNTWSFLNCVTRNFSVRKEFLGSERFDELFAYTSDPKSGYGWEDIEMGFRLYRNGARIKFAENSFAVHCSHPSVADEGTKPLRSQLNFRRLLEKYPDFVDIARPWALETFAKICAWSDALNLPHNEDRAALDRVLRPLKATLPRRKVSRKLRILSYRWHCPHQYELWSSGHDFSLIRFPVANFTSSWNYRERPLRQNAKFINLGQLDPRDFDVAILHFDENVLAPYNCNGVIPHDWGYAFQWCIENLAIPKIALCHGTPQFVGQYTPNYQGADLGSAIELERVRLVEYLRNVPVVTNSHQAEREWGFRRSRTIWQGFNPAEFQVTSYTKGVLSLGSAMESRPYYRGLKTSQNVAKVLPLDWQPEGPRVRDPDLCYSEESNDYAWARYQNYRANIRQYSVYFNPTLRSPMPRSRGEAMMCGLVSVSLNNHDVEMFIENGKNGFFANEEQELAEHLLYLHRHPSAVREIGKRSRETACDLFNRDRYLKCWEELLFDVVG